MANDYATVAEVKSYLPDYSWSGVTTYDALLALMITAASRDVDRYTNRKPGAYFVNADVTRYFAAGNGSSSPRYDERLGGGGSGGVRLWIGELAAAPTSVGVSLTGSLTTYTAYASTDYICGPYNALDDGLPYEWLEVDVINGANPIWSSFPNGNKVVGKFGYSVAVPGDIKHVVILQVIRWFKAAEQGFQTTGVMGNMTVENIFIKDKLDPDMCKKIDYLRRLAI